MTDFPLSQSSRPVEGVLWMLTTGLCFVGVNAVVHHLGTDLPTAQSAFVRFAFGVLFLAPALLRLRGGLPDGAMPLILWRGAVHTVAVVCWFYAMARLPVAEVTAIGYLNPILVMLGAGLILGEGLSARRMAVVGVALIGALIVLRPGLRELASGHFAQMASATAFAGSYLFAKRLAQMAPASTVVAILSVTVTLGLLPFAVWVWQPMTAQQLAWLALVAVFATGGHYCMTRAFAAAPMSVTQPVTFLQLLWAALLGALLFGEGVDLWVLTGGAVIIAAISLNTLFEARNPTPPQPEP